MNKRFLKQIFRAFEMMNRCYDKPDGDGGGGGEGGEGEAAGKEGEGGGAESGDLFKDSNIPLEIQDDPDLIAEMKAGKSEGEGEGGSEKPGEGEGEKEGGEAGEGEGEGKKEGGEEEKPLQKDTGIVYKEKEDSEGEEAVIDKVNEDGTYNIKVGDKTIENVKPENVAAEAEKEYSFEEDITIGDISFKKETLQKTPSEALENISRLHTKVTEMTQELEAARTTNQGVLEDPIVKERMIRLNEGKGNEPYSTYGMSKNTMETLKDKLELTEDEIKIIAEQYALDVEDNVKLAVNDAVIKQNEESKIKADVDKGVDVLLGLGEVNPKFKIKEKDIEKIWLQKEKHPEWKTFINGIGRYQKHAIEKMGFKKYSELARYKPKTLYAMIAADLDEPVAFNTKGRDQKIRQSERDKLLSIFNPKELLGGAKPMKAKASAETTKSKTSIIDDSPIDKAKLTDEEYVGNLLDNAKTDDEVIKIQNMVKGALAKTE